jgi:aromatic-L-amino-acid/L-tryptophan decarboxylase
MIDLKRTGDVSPEEFLSNSREVTEWINNYFRNIEDFPVLSSVKPGDILNSLPAEPPEKGEGINEILKELDDKLLPGITHWNHPGFMAYFNSTSSSPGILAEFIIAALNVNGMLWRTSPCSN